MCPETSFGGHDVYSLINHPYIKHAVRVWIAGIVVLPADERGEHHGEERRRLRAFDAHVLGRRLRAVVRLRRSAEFCRVLDTWLQRPVGSLVERFDIESYSDFSAK